MGSVCGIPVPEHKVNISVNIPEIVKQIEKEVIEKVELKVKEVKEVEKEVKEVEKEVKAMYKVSPVKPIEEYIKQYELYKI